MAQGSKAIVTVGNFDGVHCGHRALLQTARQRAQQAAGESGQRVEVVALTFSEHPTAVLRPEKAPRPLMPPGERAASLLQAGADRVEWLTPTAKILQLTPQQFVEHVTQRVDVIGWLEGPDFRFGKGRAGDVETLAELGREKGFGVEVIEPVEVVLEDKSVVPVRSSLVRWLVQMGRVGDAAICLGEPLTVRGTVRAGEKRGRTIGFPTANLETGDRLLPGDGVYAGLARVDNRTYAAAISVGSKPTFNAQQRAFEAYLLDYDDGSLYDRTLPVSVVRWVRQQEAYASVDALVAQLHRDVRCVRRWHERGYLDRPESAAA